MYRIERGLPGAILNYAYSPPLRSGVRVRVTRVSDGVSRVFVDNGMTDAEIIARFEREV